MQKGLIPRQSGSGRHPGKQLLDGLSVASTPPWHGKSIFDPLNELKQVFNSLQRGMQEKKAQV